MGTYSSKNTSLLFVQDLPVYYNWFTNIRRKCKILKLTRKIRVGLQDEKKKNEKMSRGKKKISGFDIVVVSSPCLSIPPRGIRYYRSSNGELANTKKKRKKNRGQIKIVFGRRNPYLFKCKFPTHLSKGFRENSEPNHQAKTQQQPDSKKKKELSCFTLSLP